MNANDRINGFAALGKALQDAVLGNSEWLTTAIEAAKTHNAWFTEEFAKHNLRQWATQLTHSNLTQWMRRYPEVSQNIHPKRVGVIMAGNIPMVGFHDFLSVLLSGNICVAKCATDDSILIRTLADKMLELEPGFTPQVQFTEKLNNIDAVIATGGNNTNRYFEYYFGKLPHLFRKNRNSVAILTGKETQAELELLSDDIFLYFGLGCRNVSKIYVPSQFDPHAFYEGMKKYASIVQHNKYANNYHYNRTVFALKKHPFYDNDFLILLEDTSLSSPVAVIHFETYNDIKTLRNQLTQRTEDIQCIAIADSEKHLFKDYSAIVSFGETQKPGLHEYADGIDTMRFLQNLGA